MLRAKSKVNFFFLNSSLSFKDRKKLKKFLISMFNKEKKSLATINYIFTDDKNLLEINKNYLNHHFLTDIITFDFSDKNQPINAEVYISAERVKENATIHKTTIKQELHRVIFHGVLHLCGYNDKTIHQINQMRKKEDYYIDEYFG
jgi:rRNA maturation RNase YbeY